MTPLGPEPGRSTRYKNRVRGSEAGHVWHPPSTAWHALELGERVPNRGRTLGTPGWEQTGSPHLGQRITLSDREHLSHLAAASSRTGRQRGRGLP